MSSCRIILENYNGTYYPGSEIRGRLECFFDDQTSIRGIKLRLKCKEHNEWTGTETYTDHSDNNRQKTRHITLSGENTVLSVEQMLFGHGHDTVKIGRGRHVYPFSYTLPSDIPSTFKGTHGSIAYKLKGIVDRPMAIDYEDAMFLVIVSPIDFNRSFREHQDAITYSDEKTVCCWCCKGGNVTMDVELPKTAFVPGETVPFQVTVTNLSNSNVENIKVKFMKKLTYKVTSPHHETKDEEETICAFNEHGVGAHGEHSYNLKLEIPKYLDVPNFARCNLFDITNELTVSCEMPSCTLDLDISIYNIKLGHIATPPMENEAPPSNVFVSTPQTPPEYPPMGVNPVPFVPSGPFPYPPSGPSPYPPSGPSPYPPDPAPYLPTGGSFYPPGLQQPPAYPPNLPQGPAEKGMYPPGPPSAPTSSFASAPVDNNPKAREAAAGGGPSAPNAPSEAPPPSYNWTQQNNAPYPPQ